MRARAAATSLLLVVACKGKLEKARDAIAAGEPETSAPRCADRASVPGCLDDGAKYFSGGTGFDGKSPDQASATAVALLVTDGHASWVDEPSAWSAVMKNGKGLGGDALRLAVAKGLADSAPLLAHELTTDEDARKLFASVSASVPGACSTYGSLASGDDPEKMDPAASPDHSACVQKDLTRVDGPGGAYGYGIWRAASAALALWKDTLRAIEGGEGLMGGASKTALDASLAILDDDTPKMTVKPVDRPAGNQWLDADHLRGK